MRIVQIKIFEKRKTAEGARKGSKNMKLGEVFFSGMVLAAKRVIRIFGSGEGCARIVFGGVEKNVTSEGDTWCAEFPAMEYGGPYTLSFETESETVSLSDIYIGEVYLFSGQSNMGMLLRETNTDASFYEDIPSLRYLGVPLAPEGMRWQMATREKVGDWSALGYLVGRAIAKEKRVHVWIILAAVGASVIESWMPAGALRRIGIDISVEEKFLDHTHETYGAWNGDGYLYEKKLARIMPLSLSGVVWYQGESDASVSEGLVYERELCEMIRIWREDFRDEALGFAIVQLADTQERIALGEGWRLIQKAQERISEHCPYTYTVVSRDICETDDIHPQTKTTLASRIAKTVVAHF